jgi:glycosyltransferase involved in cell wall biosynthesis
MKIAIVVSHPIQHFCPMYASWASIEGINLKVFFGSNLGAVKYVDPNFGKEIKWDSLYLEQFNHVFLNGENQVPININLDGQSLDIELSDFNPDLLIHYGYSNKLSKRARSWALRNKIKIGYISDAENRQKRPFLKKFLKFIFLYFYFKKIDFFFSVGDANEEYYKYYGVPVKKIKRMQFSIDVKSFDIAFENKEELRSELRLKLGIETNEIVISVVGKVISTKNQDDLIKLIFQLERDYIKIKFHLLIAGSGPMEDELKLMANSLQYNKVHFLGFVNPTDLPGVYLASDVYIHPAIRDAHSLSVSEAVYMGCPVIVSDTIGSWGENDDVQIGKNGFVYQHGNLNELQQQLLKIVEENKLEVFSKYSLQISRKFQQQSHFEMIKNLKLI